MKHSISKTLSIDNTPFAVKGLRGAAPAWLSAIVSRKTTCCCIVPDEHLVSIFEQDIKLFTDRQVLIYPGHEIPPYTPLSPDPQITAARIATLYRATENDSKHIIITSIEPLLRRVIPDRILKNEVEYLMAGEECDMDELLAGLVQLGYEQVSLAQSVGDFSVRGGIVDIFPPAFTQEDGKLHRGPVRLDFFGDTIESLRSFDPFSQRSTGEITDATLLPVTDILNRKPEENRSIGRTFIQLGKKYGWDDEETAWISDRIKNGRRFAGMEFFLPLFYGRENLQPSTVFDFLPHETTLVFVDPESIFQSMDITLERIEANFQSAEAEGKPALPPADLFLEKEEIKKRMAAFNQLLFTDFPKDNINSITVNTSDHRLLKQDIGLKRARIGVLAPLSEQIFNWQNDGDKIVICCRSERHTKNLAQLLTKHNHTIKILSPPLAPDNPVPDNQETLFLCNHSLSSGFSLLDEKLHLLSEIELFGAMRLGGRAAKKKQKGEPIRFAELADGDIVVHRDHGLGIYRGLSTVELFSVVNDFMLIEYRDGDKLYLPVDRLNLISKYEGLSDKQPKIDKLGSQSWKTTKSRIKEEVWKVAQELLDIYALREIRKGRQFSPPGHLFQELEESFPFEETPGQQKAIDDVLDDLTGEKPMDRLVCGDVGYGKTEVAIRAAFKVVEDGFQAAVLVPTTVLAEQHVKTFRERLKGFPVTVECINRFRTPAEQRRILRELAGGELNIIIGTHRLLSKDVVFHNLGLLIIDEEHRFGVAHKEKVKKMRAEVDILTLTATPIPRTLQMSLLNIRDLSVISSPPEHRRPVKTFVARYDDLVIREAVSKELRRGGQVFFVHNRVKSIYRLAASIQNLVPGARVGVAHGQMSGRELEEIMVCFVNREIDVLVSTTIIESGLDIPSANTIIINRADMLGLAEIYQLRGRVGRSSVQSFAYLLVPSIDHLSRDSRDRLRALMDCNELGGGFKLAMSDLQIRGGGNLLGVSQSGNIAAIGYDLYLDLLQKTVADLKRRGGQKDTGTIRDFIDPEINLQISAYIPASYIPDVSQRYITYRRIAALATSPADSGEDLRDELLDRYGRIPLETENLFTIVTIKKRLCLLGIKKLEKGRDTLVFHFSDDTPLRPEKLLGYLEKFQGKRKKNPPPKITPEGRLIISRKMDTTRQLFEFLSGTLTDLEKLTDHENS
ncbi:transcription-repair coupling factor [Desulfomarina sp.]